MKKLTKIFAVIFILGFGSGADAAVSQDKKTELAAEVAALYRKTRSYDSKVRLEGSARAGQDAQNIHRLLSDRNVTPSDLDLNCDSDSDFRNYIFYMSDRIESVQNMNHFVVKSIAASLTEDELSQLKQFSRTEVGKGYIAALQPRPSAISEKVNEAWAAQDSSYVPKVIYETPSTLSVLREYMAKYQDDSDTSHSLMLIQKMHDAVDPMHYTGQYPENSRTLKEVVTIYLQQCKAN